MDGMPRSTSPSANAVRYKQNTAASNEQDIGNLSNQERTVIRGADDEDETMTDEQDIYELPCPRVNCPEKIIFCMDLSAEMNNMTFRSRAGDKCCALNLVKRAMTIFMQSKLRLDHNHEFALVILQDGAIWTHDFTRHPKEIINSLDDQNGCTESEAFDLSAIFQTVKDHVVLPVVTGDQSILPPPYIVRVILIYGRSFCCPYFTERESEKLLESSPYFFIDALYVHEPVSGENRCEEIFNTLCDLDVKDLSYIFDTSRNQTKIYDYMAQLLAHPLQRPQQKDAFYKIEVSLQEEPR
ncbi:BRISC and BRCA1-A complex member 1-like [Gigantopelta aegis]|uniref:BRISC and BRCA1-A complex member 1-like n=1 Tax=Gigantopelta aegis TaxID=1735272 RepID=UPI001B88C4FE|nr:BRISC and BRCA1-A complex member 1-like [Gigantopelta aegis]